MPLHQRSRLSWCSGRSCLPSAKPRLYRQQLRPCYGIGGKGSDMIDQRRTNLSATRLTRGLLVPLAIAAAFAAGPAFAGEKEAEAALSRADVKIETVTRQAGQAGDR